MRAARRALGLAVTTAAFAVSLGARFHFDTFHHLAYGRDLLRRGGFAAEDPFLFPLAGLPSGPQPSWLGSVTIYGAWRILGEAGPGLLAAAAAAVLFLLLYLDAAEDETRPEGIAVAAVAVGLALAVCRGRLVPRPEVLAYVLLAATMLALRRQATGRARLALLLAPAVALWANLHQSVLAGLVAVGAFAAVNGAALLLGPAARRLSEVPGLRRLLAPVAAAAAGVALSAATPVGLAPFLSPLGVLSGWAASAPAPDLAAAIPASGDAAAVLRTTITELQPHSPSPLDPFDWLLLLGAVSIAVARRRNLRELATAILFCALAWRVQRFESAAAVVLAPVAGRHLRDGLGRLEPRARAVARWAVPAAGALILLGAAAAVAYRAARQTSLAALVPTRAAAYLREAGVPPRIFDTFHFGGYLEWVLDAKVYQDARGNLLPGEVRAALYGPSDREAFQTLDARWRFDALVIEYPTYDPGAARQLAAVTPDDDWAADRRLWSLVAFDDGGLLYLRRDGALAARAARDEYRHARPAVPPGIGAPDPTGLRADLERSVHEAPACARCRADLGFLLLREGRVAEAEGSFAAALAGQPLTRAQALFGLYQAALRRGDLATAEGRLREVIALAAEPAGYRRDLAVLLARSGRPAQGLAEVRKNLEGPATDPVDLRLGIELARLAGDERAERELAARLRAP
jgi:tetratricopeptide (TPR) repeat protein